MSQVLVFDVFFLHESNEVAICESMGVGMDVTMVMM